LESVDTLVELFPVFFSEPIWEVLHAEEVQMLYTNKYNHLTREVQAVIIGSKRKPTKSKSRKKHKKIPSSVRKFK
jgi:hypothetical protein